MTFHYILYSISISSECNGYLFWQSKVFVRVSSLRPVPRVAGLSLPPQASPRITQPGCYPDRVVTQPGVTRGCYQARLLPARLLPEVVTRSGCYQARLLPGQVVTRPGCYQARLLPGQVVTRPGCYPARLLPGQVVTRPGCYQARLLPGQVLPGQVVTWPECYPTGLLSFQTLPSMGPSLLVSHQYKTSIYINSLYNTFPGIICFQCNTIH